MEIKFKNGSIVKSIKSSEVIRGKRSNLITFIEDDEYFQVIEIVEKFYGFKLKWWQKLYLYIMPIFNSKKFWYK